MKHLKITIYLILAFFILYPTAFGQISDSTKTGTVKKPTTAKEGKISSIEKLDTKKPSDVPEVPLTNARIQFAEITFDFGAVPGSAQLTHHFPVKNVGLDTLVITKIKAG